MEYNVTGVTSGESITFIDIEPWIYARYLRLIVHDWHNNVSMRMELYGCQNEELLYCEYFIDVGIHTVIRTLIQY